MKRDTTISNSINQGKYEITEETEKEKQLYRGLKEKEREILHLLYYKFNQSEDFSPLELSFKTLLEEVEIDPKKSGYMRTLITSLAKTTTTFSTGQSNFKTFSIFSYLEYDNTNQKVNVKFNEDLIDFLYCDKDIKLIAKWSEYRKKKRTITKAEAVEFKDKHKGNFTVVSHSEFVLLKSSYSMELFSKLSQFKNLGKSKKYTMKEFRELLDIPLSYTPSMIKIRILEVSKKQINENTTLLIDYEIEGTAKNQSINFTIQEKNSGDKKLGKTGKKSLKNSSEAQSQFLENSSELADSEKVEKLSPEVLEFRERVKKVSKPLLKSRHFEFLAQLIPVKTIKDIEKLCEEFGILEQVKNRVNGANGFDE